jgi:hypothetical protein
MGGDEEVVVRGDGSPGRRRRRPDAEAERDVCCLRTKAVSPVLIMPIPLLRGGCDWWLENEYV